MEKTLVLSPFIFIKNLCIPQLYRTYCYSIKILVLYFFFVNYTMHFLNNIHFHTH